MLDAINGLTVIQFALLILAVALTVIQLSLLGRLMFSRAGASLIPGIIAMVLWIVLFSVTR